MLYYYLGGETYKYVYIYLRSIVDVRDDFKDLRNNGTDCIILLSKISKVYSSIIRCAS